MNTNDNKRELYTPEVDKKSLYMKMKDLLSKKKKQMGKPTPVDISEENKIKLLKTIYIFNHGDKVCEPFEYSCRVGSDMSFADLERELLTIGITIDEVVLEEKKYKLIKDQEEHDRRVAAKEYKPSDIKYFVLSTHDGQQFPFRETPESTQFLAKSGYNNAKGTCENFVDRIQDLNANYTNSSSDRKGKSYR